MCVHYKYTYILERYKISRRVKNTHSLPLVLQIPNIQLNVIYDEGKQQTPKQQLPKS